MSQEFTTTEIKSMFGLTPATLSTFNLVARQGEKKGPHVTEYYKFSEVLASWYEYKKSNDKSIFANHNDDDEEETLDRNKEEAELARERVINLRLKNKKALGEQADISVMEQSLAQMHTGTKSRLDSIPLNLKLKIPELPSSAIREIDKEIVAAKNDIAALRIDWSEIE